MSDFCNLETNGNNGKFFSNLTIIHLFYACFINF